mgnify:CR=1 FL=1
MSNRLRQTGWRNGVSAVALSAAFGAVVLIATPTMAAESNAILRGHLTSSQAGTKVTLVDASSGARVTADVQANGDYTVVGLRPGTYQVSFRTPDGKVLRQDITLSVGETAELDADLANASNEVVVVGRRREVRTSEVATNVTRAQIAALPQNGRNFLNFAALAPGVSVSNDPERKTFQAGALGANSVNLFIDGMSQKNQVLQGGVAGQDASRGNPFPQGAIQEYKVSTQNFKAEYEQSASAIIASITRSGSNEFHGEVFGTYQSKGMIGAPHFSRHLPKPDYKNIELGIVVDGPIIQDRLFYLFTYEARRDTRPTDSVLMPNAATLGGNSALATALAGAYNGSFAKDFSQDMYFGKLTFYASDADTLELSFINRVEDDVRGFGGTTARGRGNTLDQYVRGGSAQWKHRDGNYLNELSLEYQSAHWFNSPLTDAPGITLLGNPNDFNSGVARFGGLPYAQEKAQDSWTLRDSLTISNIDWHGSHIVKLGFKYAQYDYTASESIPTANPEFFYNAATYVFGGANNVPLQARVLDGNPEITDGNTQIGLFIQDDWTVNEHLTLNLGLRWDYESNQMNNDFVTPADIVTAIRAHVGFNRAWNVNDYISTGNNRDPFLGAFQPRFGFSYDVNADRNTVVFGGYGRYYDRNIYDSAQLEQRRATLHNAQINFPGNAPWNASYFTNPEQLVPLARALGLKGEIILLNNNVKVPYSDQFNFGVRQRFGSIQTSVTLAHTQSHDLFNYVLGNRQADGTWGNAWDGTHGGQYLTQPWGDGVPGYGNLIVSVSERQARNTSIYLTAEKPYTRESHYGWYAKLDLNNAEMTGHNDQFLFDQALPISAGFHHAEGVDKWRFVGSGIIDGPWNTQLGGILTLASGAPFGGFTDRGVNGSPAATLIDGLYFPRDQIAFKQLDLKLTKEFAFPNGNALIVEGQVFNAFDWVNRTYGPWTSGFANAANPIPTRQGENNTQGPSRSYQVGLKYKW